KHQVFTLDRHIGEGVQVLKLFVRHGLWLGRCGDLDWTRPQNIGGEYIEKGCFVDGFESVLPEELVPPRDEIVDVFHHHRVLVGPSAWASYKMRLEGV